MASNGNGNGHFAVTIGTGHNDDDDDNNNNNLPPSGNNRRDDNDDDDELIDPDDPFDIAQTKNASHESLRRWRVISLSYSHYWI